MEKHLEFIQGVINRHNSNSFTLKGWSVTIVAALYALAGSIKEPIIVILGLFPILLFWGLDAFYLSNERCFIDLYDAVIKNGFTLPKLKRFKTEKEIKDTVSGTIPEYQMNYRIFKVWKNNCWFYVLWSKSIFWFYFSQVLITLLVFAFFLNATKLDSGTINVDATIKSEGFKIEVNENHSDYIHSDTIE